MGRPRKKQHAKKHDPAGATAKPRAAAPTGSSTGPQSPGPLWRDPVMLIGLVSIVGLGLYLAGRYAQAMSIPFADTLTYLEVGRNFLEGRGFINRFNVIYGWHEGLSYPGLPYYNPLYGLILGIVWQAADNPITVALLMTALPAAVNAALLAVLVRGAASTLAGILAGLGYLILPTTYVSVTLITAEHPMVTVCLLILLIIQRLTTRHAAWWILVGVLLALGYLIKVTVLAMLGALFVAILLTTSGSLLPRLKRSIKPLLLLAAGFLLIITPYNAVCKIATGHFYPQYPAMAQNWSMATVYGGEFVADSPAVRPDAAAVPPLSRRATIALDNAWTMLRASWDELKLLVFLIPVGLLMTRQGARRDAVYLLCVGAVFVGAYAAAFNWLPLRDEAGSAARYVLHIAPFWYPIAILGLAALAARIPAPGAVRGTLLVIAWLGLFSPVIAQAWSMHARVSRMDTRRVDGLAGLVHGVGDLCDQDDLIAIDGGYPLICAATFLDRPVVALPQQKLATPANVRRFAEIYQPQVVVPGRCRPAYEVFPALGYRPVQLPPPHQGGRGQIVLMRPAHGAAAPAAQP